MAWKKCQMQDVHKRSKIFQMLKNKVCSNIIIQNARVTFGNESLSTGLLSVTLKASRWLLHSKTDLASKKLKVDRLSSRQPANLFCRQHWNELPCYVIPKTSKYLFPSILASKVVHNCTIFLCSLDAGNIDDQGRGPVTKEKGHLAG